MANALRKVTAERGFEPRVSTLLKAQNAEGNVR